MITIKLYENKWRLEIDNEVWELEDMDKLNLILDNIIKLKDKYGRIKK